MSLREAGSTWMVIRLSWSRKISMNGASVFTPTASEASSRKIDSYRAQLERKLSI